MELDELVDIIKKSPIVVQSVSNDTYGVIVGVMLGECMGLDKGHIYNVKWDNEFINSYNMEYENTFIVVNTPIEVLIDSKTGKYICAAASIVCESNIDNEVVFASDFVISYEDGVCKNISRAVHSSNPRKTRRITDTSVIEKLEAISGTKVIQHTNGHLTEVNL